MADQTSNDSVEFFEASEMHGADMRSSMTDEPFVDITAFMDISSPAPSASSRTLNNSSPQTDSPASRRSLAEWNEGDEIPILSRPVSPRPTRRYTLRPEPTGLYAPQRDLFPRTPAQSIPSTSSSSSSRHSSRAPSPMQQSSYSGTTQVRDSEDERNPHQTWLAPEDRIINMNRSWTVEHLAAGPDTEGTAHTAGVPQSLSLPEATSSATAAPSEPSSPAAGPSRPPTVAGPSSPSPTTLSRGRRATFFIPDSDDEEYDSDAIAAEQEEADRQHQAMINAPAYPVRVNERLRRRLTDESEARGAASDSGGGGLRSCC